MRLGRINKPTEAGFAEVRGEGLKFIEICCNNTAEAREVSKNKEIILQYKKKSGIDISSVGRWNHTLNEGGRLNEDELQTYFELLDASVALGAKTFVAGINYAEGVSLYKNYNAAIELFGRLIERADGNIRVAVQNCDWNNFVVCEREWEVVLGELEALAIKYDPSHAYSRRSNYIDELAAWGNRISHFHIKGKVLTSKAPISDPPAGMDDLRWGAIFAALYSVGYKGDLSIEPHSSVWKGALEESGVLFTKKYIEQFII